MFISPTAPLVASAPRATAPARNTAQKTAPAPKRSASALYILEDWEWERFISGEVLVDFKNKIYYGCQVCKDRGVEVPEMFTLED